MFNVRSCVHIIADMLQPGLSETLFQMQHSGAVCHGQNFLVHNSLLFLLGHTLEKHFPLYILTRQV